MYIIKRIRLQNVVLVSFVVQNMDRPLVFFLLLFCKMMIQIKKRNKKGKVGSSIDRSKKKVFMKTEFNCQTFWLVCLLVCLSVCLFVCLFVCLGFQVGLTRNKHVNCFSQWWPIHHFLIEHRSWSWSPN
jgi:hypothetical protein